MKLNKKVEIGINALHILKQRDDYVSSKVLAAEIGTTVNFLEQVMRHLRIADLVHVKRGPGGGYSFNTMYVVTALDVAKALGTINEAVEVDIRLSAQLKKNIVNAFKSTEI